MSEQIKCLVWDLDNTIWNGTLVESDACRLKRGMRSILKELSDRGILLSIASANDPAAALATLRKKGLESLFLHPQIGWQSKVRSLRTIAERIGIGLDAIGFVDDEPFELEQVRQMLPEVRTYRADAYASLLRAPELNPGVVTEESRTRRVKYVQVRERAEAERTSGMSQSEFLAHCHTRLTLRSARDHDVSRVLELLQRTHQLNSTGIIYETSEVETFVSDPRYRVYVAELEDRFVDYGRIGVAICRRDPGCWEMISFLLSCRILNRGINGFFLGWLQTEAARDGATEFRGHFRRSDRNHRMERLYRLAGFALRDVSDDGTMMFGRSPVARVRTPRWFTVHTGG